MICEKTAVIADIQNTNQNSQMHGVGDAAVESQVETGILYRKVSEDIDTMQYLQVTNVFQCQFLLSLLEWLCQLEIAQRL